MRFWGKNFQRAVIYLGLSVAIISGAARAQNAAPDGALALEAAATQTLPVQTLPADIARAFERQRIPTGSVAVWVAAADAPHNAAPLLAWQPDVAMNPASVMKLVSTYAALDALGPAYGWRTRVWLDGAIDGATLMGNVHIAGSGDPSLAGGQLWEILWKIKGLGITTIAGDIVLDHHAFAHMPHDAGAFDGEPHRPYNAGPDALLLHHKSQILHVVPDPAQGIARLVWQPPLGASQRPASVPLAPANTPCGDWRTRLAGDFVDAQAIVFHGNYPASCGVKTWPIAPAAPASFAARAVLGMWQDMGGALTGAVRAGAAPVHTQPLFAHESPALSEVIRSINKYSNNVMTQQLLLTLGREAVAAQLGSAPPAAATPSIPVAEDAASLLARLNHAQTALPPALADCVALMASAVSASQNNPVYSSTSSNTDRVTGITHAHGRCAVHRWWGERFGTLAAPALDNGAGLSRRARVSARSLGVMLGHAWRGPFMPEFAASLPIAGTDGTLRRSRTSAVAHLKTGSLRGVNALAGYVLGASGRRYVLVALINHDNAGAARPALDALTDWVARH